MEETFTMALASGNEIRSKEKRRANQEVFAVTRLLQVGDGQLSKSQGGLHVDLHGLVKVVHPELGDVVSVEQDPCVVHQHVQSSELGDGLVHSGHATVGLGEVLRGDKDVLGSGLSTPENLNIFT